LCWTTILWYCIGYSMCFGPTWHGLVGDPTYFALLNGVSLKTIYAGNNAGIPLALHFIYQMMFAIIAPALITGAFANRVNFTAYLLFLTAWLIFVYFPFVHMVWSPTHRVRQVYCRATLNSFLGNALPLLCPRSGRLPSPMRRYG
jgi:ammonium transporter, Amt family